MSLSRLAVLVGVCAGAVCAQNVISAKSGLIHYVEGVVKLDGTEVVKKSTADFPSMKQGSELRAEMGRAEILLSPGVFLRVAENSGVKLLRNDILDTALELTAGSALIEVSEAEKNQSLTVMVGDAKLDISRRGLFRIDFQPAQVRVYDGSAVVVSSGQQLTVKEGKLANLNGVIAQSKFDKEDTDAFWRWAQRRSGYIASANMAAAKRSYDRGGSMALSDWAWNPYFGMFTYLPYRGMYRSPFGYTYYSPITIGNVFYRPVYNPGYSGGGWGGGMSSSGMSTMTDRGSMASYGGYNSGGGSVMSAPSVSSSAGSSMGGGASMGSGGGSHASAGASGGGGGGGRSGGGR